MHRLEAKLDQLLSGQNLSLAQRDLSDRYRQGNQNARGFRHDQDRLAYLASRMMATYHAVRQVLSCLPQDYTPETMIDLGAGPGTATFAVQDRWPHVGATLIDTDQGILTLARTLLGDDVEYQCGPLEKLNVQADLVVSSYAFSELADPEGSAIRAWQGAKQFLVILVPGTPLAFQTLLKVRTILIQAGAHIVAPCPHQIQCPMADTEDWCHVGVKFQRPGFHQKAKGGTLGWELEKYSYLIAAKNITPKPQARIIGQPIHGSGHVHLDVCQDNGSIERLTLSRKQGALYKTAKKANWGDGF